MLSANLLVVEIVFVSLRQLPHLVCLRLRSRARIIKRIKATQRSTSFAKLVPGSLKKANQAKTKWTIFCGVNDLVIDICPMFRVKFPIHRPPISVI